MRLRHLEIFYAVMQCGTVKGAAAMLHITPPAASRLLQQAEHQAGFALFERRRGRLLPSQEAQALYPEVEQLYLKLDAIRRLVGNLALGPGGLLRVLCAPSLAEPWMSVALAALLRRHPAARVSIRTQHSSQIAESLALREADVGFGFGVEAARYPAIVSAAVAASEIVAVGPLPAGRSRDISLQALARERVIDLDPSDPLGRLLHDARAVQGVAFESKVLAHNYHTAVMLARRGLGIALVDGFTGRRLARAAEADPHWRCLPLRPRIPVTVHVMQPRDSGATLLVAHLIEALRAALESGD